MTSRRLSRRELSLINQSYLNSIHGRDSNITSREVDTDELIEISPINDNYYTHSNRAQQQLQERYAQTKPHEVTHTLWRYDDIPIDPNRIVPSFAYTIIEKSGEIIPIPAIEPRMSDTSILEGVTRTTPVKYNTTFNRINTGVFRTNPNSNVAMSNKNKQDRYDSNNSEVRSQANTGISVNGTILPKHCTAENFTPQRRILNTRSGAIDVSVIDREIREYINKTFNLIGRSKNNVRQITYNEYASMVKNYNDFLNKTFKKYGIPTNLIQQPANGIRLTLPSGSKNRSEITLMNDTVKLNPMSMAYLSSNEVSSQKNGMGKLITSNVAKMIDPISTIGVIGGTNAISKNNGGIIATAVASMLEPVRQLFIGATNLNVNRSTELHNMNYNSHIQQRGELPIYMNGINRNDEVKPILQNVTPINASVGGINAQVSSSTEHGIPSLVIRNDGDITKASISGINGNIVNQNPLDSIMRLATGVFEFITTGKYQGGAIETTQPTINYSDYVRNMRNQKRITNSVSGGVDTRPLQLPTNFKVIRHTSGSNDVISSGNNGVIDSSVNVGNRSRRIRSSNNVVVSHRASGIDVSTHNDHRVISKNNLLNRRVIGHRTIPAIPTNNETLPSLPSRGIDLHVRDQVDVNEYIFSL